MTNNILTEHFWVKIAAILFAVIIWITVTLHGGKVGIYPDSIPLNLYNVSNSQKATISVSSVKVKIAADQKVWSSLRTGNFIAFVDVAGLKEGDVELPVSIAVTKTGVQIVDIEPSKVIVQVKDR